MSEQNIPVCTLFKDAATEDDTQDAFNSSFQNVSSATLNTDKTDFSAKPSVQIDPGLETQSEKSKNEPTVCNIFQSEPSSEDLFSNIATNSFVSVKNEETKEVYTNVESNQHDNIETPEFQKISHCDKELSDVGTKEELYITQATEIPFETTKQTISEGPQCSNLIPESKDIFGDAPPDMSKVEDSKESENHSNVENVTNALTSSDLMSSIMINDSLDNLSNISFDQATSPSESTNATVKKENEVKQSATELLNSAAPSPSTAWFSGISSESKLVESNVKTVPDNYSVIEQNVESEAVSPEISSNLSNTSFLEQNEATAEPLTASTLFRSHKESSPFDTFNRSSSTAEDDAFTNALQSSEVDRRRDAWIPSEHTQTILAAVMQSQKRIQLEPKYLSRPGLATSESLGDPVKAVLARHKGLSNTSLRQALTIDSVPHDKMGLQQLINSGNHRAAIDLCGVKLEELGQGFGRATQESVHSPEALQWWHVRFSLLLRLGLHDFAETEFKQFGSFDSADLYYNFYPDLYPGRRGSMVPFSLRLLHADFPRHKNMPHQSLTQLYAIQAICTLILDNLNLNKSEDGTVVELKEEDKNASVKLWTSRKVKVMFMICNTLLQLREFHRAIITLDDVLLLEPGNALSVHSTIGRMLLQLGDIKAAQERFAQAERVAVSNDADQIQLLSNRAFLYLGANNWKEALKQFDELLKIDPNNIGALNNKAVCLLYLCRLREAIVAQEQAIKLNQSADDSTYPVSEEILLEGAISNLVTLYELESSKSNIKKQEVLKHVSMRNGDGFDVACLKM